MSLETVVDILIAHGIGGNSLRQYADREFGVVDSETGQRDASQRYDHNAAPDAQPELSETEAPASADAAPDATVNDGAPLVSEPAADTAPSPSGPAPSVTETTGA